MPNPRALDKRRKSVRNIRKITRTMELIATARFKKAMDRAVAASAYTERITQVVADLASSGVEIHHPLMVQRPATRAVLLILTGNRGLCGGYNSNAIRAGLARWQELIATMPESELEVSGKRGIGACRYRGVTPRHAFTHFEDKPRYDEVELIANRYIDAYSQGKIDRVDVVYTKFVSVAKQWVTTETLLPFGGLSLDAESPRKNSPVGGEHGGGEHGAAKGSGAIYEFHPSVAEIVEEIVPASFRVKLFKCFLDSAVSEQIARMVAMKSATENAGDLIKQLSRNYNRARQSRITSEIMDIVGGVEALSG